MEILIIPYCHTQQDTFLLLKGMYGKEGLYHADPATTKYIYPIYTQPDHAPNCINEMTRLTGSRISIKKPLLQYIYFSS